MAHPKDRPRPIDRRAFLQRAAAAGIALPSMAAILAACGDSGSTRRGCQRVGGAPAGAARQPRTLPITADNPAIADGLYPEAGPLKIFGYDDYIWKKVLNGFGDTVRRATSSTRCSTRPTRWCRRCSRTAPTST